MNDVTVANILTWFLAACFIIAAFLNSIVVPDVFREAYARWGFPDWFRYVTALVELATAVLLLFPATRLIGAGLSAAIMIVVLGTVLIHHEYVRVITPTIALGVSVVIGWLTWIRH